MNLFFHPIFTSLLISITYGICAQWVIQISESPVPITLQSLIILSLSTVQKANFSVLSVLFYLFFGIIGLPVFANGTSGIHVLMGKTGGYLFGFIPAAWFMSKSVPGHLNRNYLQILLAMLIGTAIILLFGFVVLGVKIGASAAFTHGILPFL